MPRLPALFPSFQIFLSLFLFCFIDEHTRLDQLWLYSCLVVTVPLDSHSLVLVVAFLFLGDSNGGRHRLGHSLRLSRAILKLGDGVGDSLRLGRARLKFGDGVGDSLRHSGTGNRLGDFFSDLLGDSLFRTWDRYGSLGAVHCLGLVYCLMLCDGLWIAFRLVAVRERVGNSKDTALY